MQVGGDLGQLVEAQASVRRKERRKLIGTGANRGSSVTPLSLNQEDTRQAALQGTLARSVSAHNLASTCCARRSLSWANTLRLISSTISKPSRPLAAFWLKRSMVNCSMLFLTLFQPPHMATI